MDPNTALQELRRLVADMGDRLFNTAEPLSISDGCELVETFQGLDGWITGGGFLPAPWAESRATPIPDSGLHAAADALKGHLAVGGSVNDPAWMRPQRAPRYQCKLCGAESPVGTGYVLAPGVEPSRAQPAPDCPNQHV